MRLTWVFRILFFLILGEVFLFSTSLYAEEHQIKKFQVSGKILNEEDGQPLEIATIIISNTLWATTDAEGNFMIRQVPAGKYTYEVSYLGFQKKTWNDRSRSGYRYLADSDGPFESGIG